jgi:hypothetical protein
MMVFIKGKMREMAVLVLASTFVIPAFASKTITEKSAAAVTVAPSSNPDKAGNPKATDQDVSFFDSLKPKNANIFLQVGAFGASQGNQQAVRIRGLIGDYFTVSQYYDQNVLLGLGYYINGWKSNVISLMYGLNLFVLPKTTVKGYIVQQQQFTNLSYRYSISNFPLYAAVKGLLNTGSSRYNITVDVGVGINTIHTSNFSESSLDGGLTVPDSSSFTGQTSVAPSVTAGMGVKFNNVYRGLPLEIDYRFFYLGQSNFNTANNQIVSTLRTGNSYANALFFTFRFW